MALKMRRTRTTLHHYWPYLSKAHLRAPLRPPPPQLIMLLSQQVSAFLMITFISLYRALFFVYTLGALTQVNDSLLPPCFSLAHTPLLLKRLSPPPPALFHLIGAATEVLASPRSKATCSFHLLHDRLPAAPAVAMDEMSPASLSPDGSPLLGSLACKAARPGQLHSREHCAGDGP